MKSGARAEAFMRRALTLARRGWGRTAPNPMVGAVVVRGGRIVGEGWHARYGGPHAEVMALQRAGASARGATVYVTLEPCNHWGKTPPCVDALIAAKVSRVVCATRDPGKKAGGGANRLRRAGIPVEFGVLEDDALELNAPFYFAARGSKRPWITLKLAISADGSVGRRKKRIRITGAKADREVHRMRANSDAIAIGIGTALTDDPELTVRLTRSPRVPPVRVVFDRTARLPIRSRLAASAELVPTVVLAKTPGPKRELALYRRGVEVLRIKDLRHALQVLRRHEVRTLLVEAGPTLTRAFLQARVVDRLVIFRSPRRLGAGAIAAFDDASFLERFLVTVRRRFGVDQMTCYEPFKRAP
jgi:diaminohydroxyphosphoribosylaminopyrimidine deaminase/5-amino-6-(5-phosphoribosylamino)uracil reductase